MQISNLQQYGYIRDHRPDKKDIQKSIDNGKKIPKKFRINNTLVDVTYSLQTKLVDMDEKDAIKLLEEKVITGREGFFCLKSSRD